MQTVKLAARICVVCTLLFAGSSCPTGTQSYGFLMADDIARTYVLHVPKSYDGATPVPLLVALHPFGCDAQLMQMLTGFNQISEREGFIVVYPDGRDRMWNSNPSDPFELISEPLDDVKFISALLDRLLEDYAIDPARVYVTGGSQGGLMAQRAAGEMPERVAAAATVMTTLPRKCQEHVHPKSPLTLLH